MKDTATTLPFLPLDYPELSTSGPQVSDHLEQVTVFVLADLIRRSDRGDVHSTSSVRLDYLI